MPEIGATLREARMRARIDIAEIETATKIRAKYLRALENEEWDLLPGPTFVKTFLRTYAEALGLDAKLLVDEYKLRHERLSDTELRPISPRSNARGSRAPARRPGGAIRTGGGGGRGARGPITIGLVLAVVGILALIGIFGGDSEKQASDLPVTSLPSTAATTSTPASSGTASTPARKKKPVSKVVALRIQPLGDVEVCLRAKGRPRPLIPAVTYRAGDTPNTFRSTRFTIRLGNNAVRLRINGKAFRPAASDGPIGYAITRTGKRRLPASQLPRCE